MSISIVLFTSELRAHEHPPLRAALDGSDEIVPLFVRDRSMAAAAAVGMSCGPRRAHSSRGVSPASSCAAQ
ncbi:deoxyribodipyrimidine photo-lyase [Streptomyces sp. NPDC050658]|uniref:deoxyribodipyrimidine photo-lyase n=1 Tax=Streptomyces sp. NPDC050658 TaxID=3365633 RepID=UPI0037A03793